MLRYCLLLVLVSALCVKSDVCSFSLYNAYYAACTPSEAQACFDSIPFNETFRTQTISTLRQLISLYSFTDIAQNSGEPYNVQVDLSGGLDTIATKTYTSDYAFHLDLITLFNKLNDAHTLYYAPAGYQKFYTYRPLSLTSVVSEGKQLIFVLDTTLSDSTYTYLTGDDTNITALVGKQVLKIGGIDALQYIKNFANTIGTYKDIAARFNAAISGSFEFVPQAYLPLPSDTESYEFTDKTVNLKLVTLILYGNENGIPQMQNENVFVPPSSARSSSAPKKPHLRSEGPKSLKPSVEFEKRVKNEPVAKRASTITILMTSENNDTQYGTYDANTAFFKLTTFAPSVISNKYTNPWDNYLEVFAFGIADAKSKGIKNLIVDVVGNGGGYIALCYSTLRALVKTYNTTGVYQPYDIRQSATTDSLLKIGYFDDSYLRLNTLTSYGNDTSFYNPVSRTRGGKTSKYSQLSFFNIQTKPDFYIENNNYYFDKIIALTDGTCGSACAYFVTKLKQDQKALIVSAGGIYGQDMDIGAFAGGNVEDWDPFVEYIGAYLAYYSKTMTNQPVYLPTSAATRFNFNEAYFYNITAPREYIRVAADKTLNNWFYNYPEIIYPDVQPFFASMPSGWPSSSGVYDITTEGGSSSTTGDDSGAVKMTGFVSLVVALIALLI